MNSEKYELNAETRRSYIVKTLFRGFKKIFANWRAALVYAAVMLVLGLLLQLSCDDADGFVTTIQELLLKILYIMLFPLVATAFGYVCGSFSFYRNMIRAGFVNSAGEAPVLVDRHRVGNAEDLVFEVKGIPLTKWTESKERLQSALNLTIGTISIGKNYQTVIMRAADANTHFPPVITWQDSYLPQNESVFALGKTIAYENVEIDIDKQPMILLAGSTGSGKTNLAICLCQQALLRGADVKVIDFKGIDFFDLRRKGAEILTDPEGIIATLHGTFAEIEYRRELFTSAETENLTAYREKMGNGMNRIVILIDECAMLSNFGVSKEAKLFSAEIIDLLSGIARVGRAYGVHLIISTQRPDQNAVPGSIKSNMDIRICGKADTTLSEIVLGDGRANQLIPKNAQGRFVMGGDGDDDIVFQAFYVEKR